MLLSETLNLGFNFLQEIIIKHLKNVHFRNIIIHEINIFYNSFSNWNYRNNATFWQYSIRIYRPNLVEDLVPSSGQTIELYDYDKSTNVLQVL